MYKKILVPLDGSRLAEQVLPYARMLAAGFDAPLTLLRINDIDNMTPYAPPLGGGDYLKEVTAKYLPQPLKVEHVVELGKPAQIIVEQARSEQGTLIAMATHGMSGMRRWLLGSVASKVLQATAHPLLLIRPPDALDPARPVQLKTVFVPLDGSRLAESILPHVIALAKNLKLEVQLVRVYQAYRDAYIGAEGAYLPELRLQAETLRQDAERYLEGKVQELRGLGLDGAISIAVEGNAPDEIIDLAQATPDNLIAMSTHGRSGVGDWVLGSVTEKVVTYSKDPVFVLRPG